jgi:hypothetical protein
MNPRNSRSLRARIAVAGCVIASIAAAHCGGSTSSGGGSGTSADGGPVPNPFDPGPTQPGPTDHRPTAPTCDSTRPAGLNADAGLPDSGVPIGQCARDADCTQGRNGRCLPPQHNAIGDYCSYDECSTDADCGAGKVCACGTSLGTYGSSGTSMRTGNRCLPANCHVDADCGVGGLCSPTYDTTCGAYNGVVGYYCHTPKDECSTDASCSDGGGVGAYCAWAPQSGKWICSHSFCAG